ncbi:MAG TPA: pectate lyase [Pyrinomonadaceae bacterium]
MTSRLTIWVAGLLLASAVFCAPAARAQKTNDKSTASNSPIDWKESLKQKPEWYASDEAVRIADNVLLYQHEDGGWSKNIDMARVLTEKEKAGIVKQKSEAASNIDNGATYTQLAYLAKVYTARKLDRHQDAFLKGVDYLFGAQYANGGWPQYYPVRKGYYGHITFNDNAMINVMRLLRDIAQKKSSYLFVDEERRRRAGSAVEKGVELILKTQVVVKGERTVWGAQHDAMTLLPAPARKFEPASLSAGESVDIVRFLMNIKQPDSRVIEAIESAVAWFEKTKINGIRWVEKRDASKGGIFERVAVKDPGAEPIWARFYEIGTNRPIFMGRDGVIKYDVMEIEAERRNNYRWYVEEPSELLAKDYPAWKKKLSGLN